MEDIFKFQEGQRFALNRVEMRIEQLLYDGRYKDDYFVDLGWEEILKYAITEIRKIKIETEN